jgi:hypothetical protein
MCEGLGVEGMGSGHSNCLAVCLVKIACAACCSRDPNSRSLSWFGLALILIQTNPLPVLAVKSEVPVVLGMRLTRPPDQPLRA